MKLASAALAIILIFSLGVVSYADGDAATGLSVHSSSDSSSDDPGADDRSPATETDLEAVTDAEDILDGRTIILLESGKVTLETDSADSKGAALKSASSSSEVDTSSYGYYIDISSSAGSRLYVPSDYREDSFYVNSDGIMFGMRSSTFTCYTDGYYVRFPAYSSPQYRSMSSTSYNTWNDLDIYYEDSPNVAVLGARMNWFGDRFQALIGVAALAFLIILVLRRK